MCFGGLRRKVALHRDGDVVLLYNPGHTPGLPPLLPTPCCRNDLDTYGDRCSLAYPKPCSI